METGRGVLMLGPVIKELIRRGLLSKEELFCLLAETIKEYNLHLYLEDFGGVITKLHADDLAYIAATGFSADAVPLLKALAREINRHSVCIDVGASVGLTTIWLAKRSKRVYAFEPEENNFRILLENIRVNSVANIIPFNAAVTDKTAKARLHILSSYGHHSLGAVKTSPEIDVRTVKTISLDRFCQEKKIDRIDLLKIDVEGFELEVLMGARKLLTNKSIKIIAFEVSKGPLQDLGKSAGKIYDYLVSFGYEICDLDMHPISRQSLSKINFADILALAK